MKMYSRQFRAFTLVEILVVVGVIGVLIAVLILSTIFAMRALERMKHESRINQIQLTITDFKQKTMDYPKYVTGKTGAESLMDRLTKDQYIGMKKYDALLPANHQFVGELKDGTKFLQDPRGNPILYYRSCNEWTDDNGTVDVSDDVINDPEALWDDVKGVYRPSDNTDLLDKFGFDADQWPDLSKLISTDSPEYGRLFSSRVLIIAAGIDGLFGTDDDLYKWELE